MGWRKRWGFPHQTGASADASALAGALWVETDQVLARDKAVEFAAANQVAKQAMGVDRNDANAPDGDVVLGFYQLSTSTFTPTTTGPNAVRVRARRTEGSVTGPLPVLMASMFGFGDAEVARVATAMTIAGGGPGVIALNPTESCTFMMRGTSGLVRVNGGVIVVDSDHPTAACRNGQPTVDTDLVYIVGDHENGFEQSVTGSVATGRPYVPDPLAALPEPNEPSDDHGNVRVNGNKKVTLSPGRYGDITVTGNNAEVTLLPGLYYIEGEFKHNGGLIDGTAGVMLFIAPGGNIDIAGNGTFKAHGMSTTVYPNGPAVPASVADIPVPIFQSRSNTTTAELNGTTGWDLTGTIYTPAAQMLIRGTPDAFANGLIADKIETRGNEDLIIDYDDQFPKLPGSVFLVE